MRLTSVEVAPFELALAAPVRTARTVHAARPAFLVRIESDAGLRGFGEAAPLPSHGTESPQACRAALSGLGALVGRPLQALRDVDGLLAGLHALRAPAARHAAELALLDLLAQEQGVPVAALLAGELRSSVPVNALLTATEADALAHEAQQRIAEGFTTLKLKVGGATLEDDLARIRAVRQAAGAEVALRIDANAGWSLAEARLRLPAMHREGRLELCEQPVAALEALATLQRELELPLAADELLADPAVAREVVPLRAARVLVLKPMVLGGLRPAHALAVQAHEAGLAALVTTTLDGAVARAGALHLACALPGPRLACGLDTGRLLARDVGPDPVTISRGEAACPRSSGLGVRPDAVLAWEAP